MYLTLEVAEIMLEADVSFTQSELANKLGCTYSQANGVMWNIYRAPKYIIERDTSQRSLAFRVLAIEKAKWAKNASAETDKVVQEDSSSANSFDLAMKAFSTGRQLKAQGASHV